MIVIIIPLCCPSSPHIKQVEGKRSATLQLRCSSLPFFESSLCKGFCKHIIDFSQLPGIYQLLLILLYRQGNWGSERWQELAIINSRAKCQSHVAPEPTFLPRTQVTKGATATLSWAPTTCKALSWLHRWWIVTGATPSFTNPIVLVRKTHFAHIFSHVPLWGHGRNRICRKPISLLSSSMGWYRNTISVSYFST